LLPEPSIYSEKNISLEAADPSVVVALTGADCADLLPASSFIKL